MGNLFSRSKVQAVEPAKRKRCMVMSTNLAIFSPIKATIGTKKVKNNHRSGENPTQEALLATTGGNCVQASGEFQNV